MGKLIKKALATMFILSSLLLSANAADLATDSCESGSEYESSYDYVCVCVVVDFLRTPSGEYMAVLERMYDMENYNNNHLYAIEAEDWWYGDIAIVPFNSMGTTDPIDDYVVFNEMYRPTYYGQTEWSNFVALEYQEHIFEVYGGDED